MSGTGRRKTSRTVYVVDGSRTPCLKARGIPGPFSASDLAVNAARPLLARQAFEPGELDEVILGSIMPGPDEANIARVVALRLGCGNQIPAWTVQRNCGTGLQAIDSAAHNIATGRAELILAGGTESMSHAPLLWSKAMVTWLGRFTMARDLGSRARGIHPLSPCLIKTGDCIVTWSYRSCRGSFHGTDRGGTGPSFLYQPGRDGCLCGTQSPPAGGRPGAGKVAGSRNHL